MEGNKTQSSQRPDSGHEAGRAVIVYQQSVARDENIPVEVKENIELICHLPLTP